MPLIILRFVLAVVMFVTPLHLDAESKILKIGVATILTGDLGILGQNVALTAETYRKHFAKHPFEIVTEDSKLSGPDGLKAYQSLISFRKVPLIISAVSTNGTLAAKELINRNDLVVISVVTGGKNIDTAGENIFRFGNSDTLNGLQQADYLISKNIKSVALLTEDTEYSQDVAISFKEQFKKLGGKLVYDESFAPGSTDFRSYVTRIKTTNPQALFIPTQTGMAYGLFLKQWHQQNPGDKREFYTTFVAAPNPDAHAAAGELIKGTYYMDPAYDSENPQFKKFLEAYRVDHGREPAIPFHSAGVVDALTLLDEFLETRKEFFPTKFRAFLMNRVQNYDGCMGRYSLDTNGNSNIGFTTKLIE